MHFQHKMTGNGRNNTFREKEATNKGPLMLLDDKVLPER